MRLKIRDACIGAKCFYYLGLRLALSSTLQKVQRFIVLPQPIRTGHMCPAPVWRLGLCEMVGQLPSKLSGEDHSKP